MSREDQIEQAAKKEMARIASHATLYKGTIDEIEVYEPDDMIDMFKLGAEYADSHPDLYTVTRKAVERERKRLIEKAAGWITKRQVVDLEVRNIGVFINDFIKYMEEQQ